MYKLILNKILMLRTHHQYAGSTDKIDVDIKTLKTATTVIHSHAKSSCYMVQSHSEDAL